MPESLREAFLARVDVEPGGCWVWQGGASVKGVPRLHRDGRMWGARHLSWWMTYGYHPHGRHLVVMCGNPMCVAPKCVGFAAVQHGREVQAGRPWWTRSRTKITRDVAIEIARSVLPTPYLAREHGVSEDFIRKLRRDPSLKEAAL